MTSCVLLFGYVMKAAFFVEATLEWKICSREASIGSAKSRPGWGDLCL